MTDCFRLYRKWTGPFAKTSNTNSGRSTAVECCTLTLDISSSYLRILILAREQLAPTTCEWSQIAEDINDYIVLNDNDDERGASIEFVRCSFLAATPLCPGWQSLLEQLNRISNHASSLLVEFRDCAFASEDMRQTIAHALAQMNATRVHFERWPEPKFCEREPITKTLRETRFDRYGPEGTFYGVNNRYDDGLQSISICGEPTSRQWQEMATLIAKNTVSECDRMELSCRSVQFWRNAGLETFFVAMAGMAIHPKSGTIRRRMNFIVDSCEFLDAEAVHSIGTALALNKGVDSVNLKEIDEQPLCTLVDLLSQSSSLSYVRFDIPCTLEHRDCIRKSLAASTGLVSVKFRHPLFDETDYTEFVRDVRSSVTAAAFKTRGRYRNWNILSVKDLPHHCEYVQFGMPRLIVTATRSKKRLHRLIGAAGPQLYADDARNDDLYRLTVLYDMLKSCNAVLQQVGNNAVESVSKCKKAQAQPAAYVVTLK